MSNLKKHYGDINVIAPRDITLIPMIYTHKDTGIPGLSLNVLGLKVKEEDKLKLTKAIGILLTKYGETATFEDEPEVEVKSDRTVYEVIDEIIDNNYLNPEHSFFKDITKRSDEFIEYKIQLLKERLVESRMSANSDHIASWIILDERTLDLYEKEKEKRRLSCVRTD